jgi:hypothetical protein
MPQYPFRRRLPLALAVAMPFALAACGGGDAPADEEAAPATDQAAEAEMEMEAPPMQAYMVAMNGAAERPDPVETKAMGETSLIVFGDSIQYAVNALDITGITGVHIHKGGPEEAGGVIISLATSDEGMDPNNGSVVTGTITREDALGQDVTFDQLKELLVSGMAYVNIHTKAHPAGEIRGAVETTM